MTRDGSIGWPNGSILGEGYEEDRRTLEELYPPPAVVLSERRALRNQGRATPIKWVVPRGN
jgi:hypothetical protein